MAFPKGEGGFSGNAAAILANAGYSPSEKLVTSAPETPAVLGQIYAMIAELTSLVERFPDWTYAEVASTIERVNALLNRLKNLGECEVLLLGEANVETWIDLLTLSVRRLIFGLTELNLFAPLGDVQFLRGPEFEARSDSWQMLVHLAARTGVIGAGAVDEDLARDAEGILRTTGGQILEMNIGSDGQLVANDHTVRVLTTGAAMGWTFEVNGLDVDPLEHLTTAIAAVG